MLNHAAFIQATIQSSCIYATPDFTVCSDVIELIAYTCNLVELSVYFIYYHEYRLAIAIINPIEQFPENVAI
ncbi:MAG: hypothetical protein RMX65_022000 [Nostoc sp. DedQUE01]|nr:hypothetical protein [Nostoc sp. DedQUE01]